LENSRSDGQRHGRRHGFGGWGEPSGRADGARGQEKDGTEDLKLIPECNLPLTGVGVVDVIITDLGVMEVTDNGLRLIELAPGVSVQEVQAKTTAKLDVSAVV